MLGETAATTIGQRVRATRERLGLSMQDVAAPGVSRTYVSLIEGGRRRPSLKATRALAESLGVSAHWLETGGEDPAHELAILVLGAGAKASPMMRQLARKVLDQ